MWKAPKSSLRTYGTHKWQLSLADKEWWSSPEYHVGRQVLSPYFLIGGYLWHFNLYPRGRPDSTGHIALYLTCTGSLPEEAVYFQLVIQNQDDEEKTCHREFSRVFTGKHWGTAKMLSTEALFDVNSGFVKERELVIGVHISVVAADHSSFRRQAALPSPSVSDVFETHFDDASTCDITVKAGAIKIHAHKIVLIAQSAMFRAMFQSGTKENLQREVEMKDITGLVLEALIMYMYGRLKSVPAHLALQLFVAADAHQVELLRWTCLQQIISQISTTTVLQNATIADEVTDKTLMDACVSFMVETECSVEVMEGPAMQRLMQSNTELAQKLLVDVVKQTTKKRKADELA